MTDLELRDERFTPTWLVPADVTSWLALNARDEATPPELVARCAAAAEPFVERCRPEWADTAEDGAATYTPDAETYTGAVMLAAREVRRRNSPTGVQSFGEAGVSYVARFDPEINRALRLADWAMPGVG